MEKVKRHDHNSIHTQLIDHVPMGILVFNKNLKVVYLNKRATTLTERYNIKTMTGKICRRAFNAIKNNTVKHLFPGEIYIKKRSKKTGRSILLNLHITETPVPLVFVYAMEESLSNRVDINAIRRVYGLTRREADVLRGIVNGLRAIDIAKEMGISRYTAKDYAKKIHKKLAQKIKWN